jgi:hypothetical protein
MHITLSKDFYFIIVLKLLFDLCIYVIGVELNPRMHYIICISPYPIIVEKSVSNAMLSG